MAKAPGDGPPRVEQIDHIELFVPDRYEAAEWYADALGFEILPDFEMWAEDDSGPLMISSDGGNTKIALFTGPPQGGEEIVGLRRLAFRVDGASFFRLVSGDPESPRLRADGEPLSVADVVDHEKAYSVYFRDSWGNQLEITTYDYVEVSQLLG